MRVALPAPVRASAKAPSRHAAAQTRSQPLRGPAIATRCACGGSCPRCSGGAPLAAALRQRMESRLGAPLGDVRVHTDAAAHRAAQAAGAHAFTLGAHLFFAAGRFAPETTEGATRLAHELVHALQQRRGRNGDRLARPTATEREARALGSAAAAGQRAAVRMAAPLAVQRDGPGEAGGVAPAPAPQLHLDPEIERELLLRQFVRWWIGSLLVDGAAPDAVPQGDATDSGEAPALPAGPPQLPSTFTLPPLQPDFFAPLPRDPFAIEPDVGALFTPFHERGAPIQGGDDAAAMAIFRRNAAIARGLPDLRAIAPRFVRPLIPTTWRRDIAGALTGAAIGAALKNDYATPIEVGDRVWLNMTGASTTVVPLPAISFDLF